ncbi:BEL1-like homeodomain protein 8 [Striga hermonthica]|uniref:BEL1-like homeodomain protein 8 n=1 Tax=Striga hermonthica TaxID=68872 RepID=A0A9N7MX38_STRHE|nr:BEL1-like homeodomain protein 8 [Striga hermonthica]
MEANDSIHVAQQRRRDRLRILHQQAYYSANQLPFSSQQEDVLIYQRRDCLAAHDEQELLDNENNNNNNNDLCRQVPTVSFNQVSDKQPYFGSHSATDSCWGQGPNTVPGVGLPGDFHPCNLDQQSPNCGLVNPSFNQNPLQELVSSCDHLQSSSPEGTWSVDGGLLSSQDNLIRHFADGVHYTHRGLALSLSSLPSAQFAQGDFTFLANDKVSRQGAQAASAHNRCPGPLGPFTGYATILRTSRFLRPAQVLLEELCCMARPVDTQTCEGLGKILEQDRVSVEDDAQLGSNPIAAGSLFGSNGSNEKIREGEGAGGWTYSCLPNNFQKKAKLLCMQDEVCKRYKQYQQQMQMVVSSFESVAGLSAATPYISLALKMVSKNFRCLKNSITDQLKDIRGAIGEVPSSPSAGTSSGKVGASSSMIKFFDQSFQKQNNVGLLQGQHVWRPQRGLPERAVSILRAWLFDHFLHPYPTDTDKHMLAAQTGLTRNQVSNWFINARVRVWKPMVEEIHMLETKGNSNMCTEDKTATATVCGQPNDTAGQCSNTIRRSSCSSLDPTEKRSRMNYYHVPNSDAINGSLMGFVPPSNGVEMAGLGPVSLTLGLRQSAENGHQMHYGSRVLRDFVG